jgi:integrase
VVDTIRNFGAAIADKSPALETLRTYGVIGGYDLAQNVEKSGRDLAKDLRKKTGTQTKKEKILSATGIMPLWEALEKGSSASDAATRMAVFKATMEETGNEVEAAFRAMEVMNFNRKGNSAVIRIHGHHPFLNARIQGLDVRTVPVSDQSSRVLHQRSRKRLSLNPSHPGHDLGWAVCHVLHVDAGR